MYNVSGKQKFHFFSPSRKNVGTFSRSGISAIRASGPRLKSQYERLEQGIYKFVAPYPHTDLSSQ